MGTEPIIILMTGHALVAVRATAGDDSIWIYSETTLVGHDTFENAVRSAEELIAQKLRENSDPMLLLVNIQLMRRTGITALNL